MVCGRQISTARDDTYIYIFIYIASLCTIQKNVYTYIHHLAEVFHCMSTPGCNSLRRCIHIYTHIYIYIYVYWRIKYEDIYIFTCIYHLAEVFHGVCAPDFDSLRRRGPVIVHVFGLFHVDSEMCWVSDVPHTIHIPALMYVISNSDWPGRNLAIRPECKKINWWLKGATVNGSRR